MPFKNVPPELTGKMDDCVKKVNAKGSVDNAYAVCYASVVEGASAEQIVERFDVTPEVMDVIAAFAAKPSSAKAGEGEGAEGFSERLAFEPFKQIDYTKPIKVMPLGTWYRGDRTLTPDDKRAQEMVANFKQGLPRYGVKVNIEHNGSGDHGKVGTIKDVYFKPGDGVYALTEFTDIGKKLLEEERYDGVSPEVVWTLNNDAKYQDPQTGKWHDNVLVGMALTNSAYFGNQVAVFSAKPNQSAVGSGQWADLLSGFKSLLKQAFAERFGDGPGIHDVNLEGAMDHKDMTAHHGEDGQPDKGKLKAALGKDGISADEKNHLQDHLDAMDEEDKQDKGTDEEKEKASAKLSPTGSLSGGHPMEKQITAEQFAEVKAKADMVDQFKAKLEQAEAESKKLAEQFAAEQLIRRTNEFRAEAEKFSALPTETTKLGDHLLWLDSADTSKDKEHFAYFNGLLQTLNKVVAQSALFESFATGRTTETNAHPFLAEVARIQKEKFSDKPEAEAFSSAFKAASKAQPKLAAQYVADKQAGRL